jgi:hypothetical protein
MKRRYPETHSVRESVSTRNEGPALSDYYQPRYNPHRYNQRANLLIKLAPVFRARCKILRTKFYTQPEYLFRCLSPQPKMTLTHTVPVSFILSLSLLAQSSVRNELEIIRLSGPVRSVRVEVFDPPDAVAPRMSDETIYDTSGFRIEETRRNSDNKIMYQRVLTRDRWKVFKEVFSRAQNDSESRTRINRFNSSGAVEAVEVYDSAGHLLEKSDSTYSVGGDESTEVHTSSDSNGSEIKSTTQTIEATDRSSGITTQKVMRDGKPYSNWVIRRNQAGEVLSDAIAVGDTSQERVYNDDGSSVEHQFSPSTKTHTFQTNDNDGRILELIVDSPTDYMRQTRTYDKRGNEIESRNYDRSGRLLSKFTTEYLNEDANGNWTEMRKYRQDSNSQEQTLVERLRRTISYY